MDERTRQNVIDALNGEKTECRYWTTSDETFVWWVDSKGTAHTASNLMWYFSPPFCSAYELPQPDMREISEEEARRIVEGEDEEQISECGWKADWTWPGLDSPSPEDTQKEVIARHNRQIQEAYEVWPGDAVREVDRLKEENERLRQKTDTKWKRDGDHADPKTLRELAAFPQPFALVFPQRLEAIADEIEALRDVRQNPTAWTCETCGCLRTRNGCAACERRNKTERTIAAGNRINQCVRERDEAVSRAEAAEAKLDHLQNDLPLMVHDKMAYRESQRVGDRAEGACCEAFKELLGEDGDEEGEW